MRQGGWLSRSASGRLFFYFLEIADLIHELGDVAEFLVHAGEADIGNLVDLAQPGHDGVADGAARNFRLVPGLKFVEDVVDRHGQLLQIDRALVAGGADGMEQLFAVEFLAAAVALNYSQTLAHQRLGGGETVSALQALAAPANGRS